MAATASSAAAAVLPRWVAFSDAIMRTICRSGLPPEII
jgi:hypothetical protein